MTAMLSRTGSVASRVLTQLRRDRRFVATALIAPLMILFFVKTLFDATDVRTVQVDRFAVPFGAFIVHFATFVLTAIVLVRERVAETLERMFISGYRRLEIVTGYLLAYTTLATVVSIGVITELELLFDLGYGVGGLAQLFVVVWLLAVISMALGILVSNFARTEGQVIPFIPAVIVPSFIFSGVIVAVDRLPVWSQVISRLSPMFYANEVLQEIVGGGGLLSDTASLLLLMLYGALVLSVATWTLREQH
jgi:ABC-2 type transport system permease protein